MSISIEELNRMNPDSYQIIDIRDEAEIGHGAIPGAVAVATEEIEGNEKIDFSKKLVICCSRGKYSVDVAEELSEKGIDAESLEGGYIAWLIDNMKQKEAAEKAFEGCFADIENTHTLCKHSCNGFKLCNILFKLVDNSIVCTRKKLNKQSACKQNLAVLFVNQHTQGTNCGNLFACCVVVCNILGNFTADKLNLTYVRIA